jgi:hypothetical protein
MPIDSRDLLARLRVTTDALISKPGTIPIVTELLEATERLTKALSANDDIELQRARLGAEAALDRAAGRR